MMTANELVNRICISGMEPVEYKAIPRGNRFGLKVNAYLMDEVPKDLHVVKEFDLDFWNDIEGYFLANNGRIVDFRDSDWEIPNVETINRNNTTKNSDGNPLFTVGDRIINKDYEVYKVVGFICDGYSQYYFDIK